MIFIHLVFLIVLFATSCEAVFKKIKPIAIYHAHNLPFKEIKNKLPKLAEMGFSHIQISPPQKSRNTLPDHKKLNSPEQEMYEKIWWLHYQPERYVIDDTLGNQSELYQLIIEAQKLDMSIIADVVLTHIRAPDHVESQDWKSAYLACQLCTYIKGQESREHIQCTDVRGNPFNTCRILPDLEILRNQTILSDIESCKKISSYASNKLENLYLKLQPIVASFLGIKEESVDLRTISEVIYPWRLGYQPGSWTSGFGTPALRTGSSSVQKLQQNYLTLLVSLGIGGFRYDAASNLPPISLQSLKNISKAIPHFFQYGEIVDTLDNTKNWKSTMGISATNYPFLLSLKNALSHQGSLQSIWEVYAHHIQDDDVIFTATHDTFGKDVALRYYMMEDAQNSLAITNDNLLALSIILALPKGVPLILHDYVDETMTFYAPHPLDPKRLNAPEQIVQNGLKFRKIMSEKGYNQDYFSYRDHDPNILVIERYQKSDEISGGFAIINKGLEHHSYQALLSNTNFLKGCYQSLGKEPVTILAQENHEPKVISGDPLFPKREAKFFVQVKDEQCKRSLSKSH